MTGYILWPLRIRLRIPLSLVCVWVVLATYAAPQPVFAEATTEHSFVVDKDKKRVWSDELLKAIRDRLTVAGEGEGDPRQALYKNLQVVVSACNSGAFATEAAASPLPGNWSVHTSSWTGSITTWKAQVDDKPGNPKNGQIGGKLGLKYAWYNKYDQDEPAEENKVWMHGWTAQYIKKLLADGDATSKELAEFATSNNYPPIKKDKPEKPQFKFGGDGDKFKVHEGADKYFAVLWGGADIDYTTDHVTKLADALKATGYTDATIDLTMGSVRSELPDGEENKFWPPLAADDTRALRHKVDRDGTRDALLGSGKMIDTLKASLAAAPGKHNAFIYLDAHGGYEKRETRKKDEAAPGAQDQGFEYHSGDATSLSIDDAFREHFFEDIGLFDREEVFRVAPPAVLISTVAELLTTAITAVGVSIGGVPVGSFELLGTPGGNQYEVPIDDTTLMTLLDSGVFASPQLEINFDFLSGSQSDFFRVATLEDFEAGGLERYGVGLATPAVFAVSVPEPGTGFLLAVAFGWLLVSRRERHP